MNRNSYAVFIHVLHVHTTVRLIVHVMAMFSLTVANKPYFEEFPQDKTVLEGKKVVLPVKIDSNPPATLTWYHDNTRLNNDYAHEISSKGSLTIMTAEMSHTGTYQLVATNSEGTAESQLMLKVIPEAQKAPPKPPPPKPVPFQGKAGIPVSSFGQYVSQNHANTNKGFTTLYNVSLLINFSCSFSLSFF